MKIWRNFLNWIATFSNKHKSLEKDLNFAFNLIEDLQDANERLTETIEKLAKTSSAVIKEQELQYLDYAELKSIIKELGEQNKIILDALNKAAKITPTNSSASTSVYINEFSVEKKKTPGDDKPN